MWEANKVPDKELAPSTLGCRRPLEYRGVPCLGLPLAWILKAGQVSRHSEPPHPRWEFSQKLERRYGETSPATGPILYCSEGLLYFLIIHRDQWVTQSYAALAAQTHQNQAFLSAYLVVYTSLR